MEKDGSKKSKITLEQFVKILFLKTLNAISVAKETLQEQNISIKDLILQYSSKLPSPIKNHLIAQIIKKGQEAREIKLAEGYKETPDGLLSPLDIEKAGYIAKDGVYFIPAQYYISEENINGHAKGQKYLGVSEQYLQWRRDRKAKSESPIDYYIDKEIEKEAFNF